MTARYVEGLQRRADSMVGECRSSGHSTSHGPYPIGAMELRFDGYYWVLRVTRPVGVPLSRFRTAFKIPWSALETSDEHNIRFRWEGSGESAVYHSPESWKVAPPPRPPCPGGSIYEKIRKRTEEWYRW